MQTNYALKTRLLCALIGNIVGSEMAKVISTEKEYSAYCELIRDVFRVSYNLKSISIETLIDLFDREIEDISETINDYEKENLSKPELEEAL